MTLAATRFHEVRTELTQWLFDKALPLWGGIGVDRESGGFFEKIGRHGRAIEEPRRTRVIGRQIYAFATAKSLGWSGPADALIGHGLTYFHGHCLGDGGRAIAVSKPGGIVVDDRFDLYDQAFALFGLAAAAPHRDDRLEIAATARRLRQRVEVGWRHPERGFEESRPRTLPLKANPHMHVFEAALAWMEVDGGADPGWRALADEIGALCLDRFLHPPTGAIREFYDGDWNAMSGEAGRIIEPGHQFEWAWLLVRWGAMAARPDAIAAARRLVAIGEDYGVDEERGVAFNELWDDLTVKDYRARLWPQTERIKAWIAMASIGETNAARDAALDRAALAARGLQKYLAADVIGSWNERMLEDGSFLDEPSPASSLYHITCAIVEMQKVGPGAG